jgi:predicted RNase H-like nuclease (RuvC/YqgF family)
VDIVDDVPQSDFVFSEDYELTPLKDVETYIKQHKHLPNIPSADEFKANGYSIGQMDNLLLQKVEELTLHAIEQEKKIGKQEKEIEDLKQQNKKLTEQNKKIEELQDKLEKIEAKINSR